MPTFANRYAFILLDLFHLIGQVKVFLAPGGALQPACRQGEILDSRSPSAYGEKRCHVGHLNGRCIHRVAKRKQIVTLGLWQ